MRNRDGSSNQHTLRNPIGCVGVGFHTGARVACTLHPASAGSGIRFTRTDRPGCRPLAARLDLVADTAKCCTLIGDDGMRVASIEHLMAALAICQIDNVRIEISGPEVPAMDGSALPFVRLVECAGSEAQPEPRGVIEVVSPIHLNWGGGSASLLPSPSLIVDSKPRGTYQHPENWLFADGVDEETLRREVVAARTHMICAELNAWLRSGLARGASEQNTVVGEPADRLSGSGRAFCDALLRHHLLDLLGDIRLLPYPLQARYEATEDEPGLCRQALRALLADRDAWRVYGIPQDQDLKPLPGRVSAARALDLA